MAMRELETSLQFCQQPSQRYLQMLEECGNDPRSVAGRYALERSLNGQRGWIPDFDARDIRKK
ncbi:MAG: hypothetical protein Q8P92_01165 [Candidatus Daviesbacteria bacterium]|nr:hypothetical protein [Candidatus Daviesbacteria bacterium]